MKEKTSEESYGKSRSYNNRKCGKKTQQGILT